MAKYEIGLRVVDAEYGEDKTGNPFVAAMPDVLCIKDLYDAIRSMPTFPPNLSDMTMSERRQLITMLASVFVPLDYMYTVYDYLYRAIATTYTTFEVVEHVKKINELFCGKHQSYATQTESGSILGVPGVGKTSTIRRCLSVMPQVICHTQYMGQPCYCKQVLYLRVECPSDCSIKTLALNICAALDKAIGTKYLDRFAVTRSLAVSAMATQVKIICLTHHVGLIVVDEIQNAILTAQANKQVKPLIRFLVELTNDTSTAVCFVGTPIAEEMFLAQEHLKRRTRGIRLLPMKPDETYHQFLEQIWGYQVTPKMTPLTEALMNKIYDSSGGIPSYIIKIFQETQIHALMSGKEKIDTKVMQETIDMLAIKPPKVYVGGVSISDVEIQSFEESKMEKVPRQFAKTRGRPAVIRDEVDLLAAYKAENNFVQWLVEHGLVEGI